MSAEATEQIYTKPDSYDLEHASPEPDIGFFVRLARELRPRSILEIACGNGRVTLPLAAAAKQWGGEVTGLEICPEMLESASRKPGADQVRWIEGDLRIWQATQPFDLIVSPCASLSHLLELDDQLAAWRHAYANLLPGGRFVVAEMMANLPVLAESMQIPPRAAVEIDGDQEDEWKGQRLLRCRSTRYHAHDQRATVHFLYDQFTNGEKPERFVSDYQSHVYFPRELQLLFLSAGFLIEHIWGGYRREPLRHASRQIVICGARP